MNGAPASSDLEARLRAVEDRLAVTDVLYRYASTIDTRDLATLRTLFADGFRGKYGDADWIEGGDAVVDWIDRMTVDKAWQHHLLSVYHVEIDGDSATTLTYHTSHQVTPDKMKQPTVIVARYHDKLVRTPDGWKLTEKVMETLYRGIRNAADAL